MQKIAFMQESCSHMVIFLNGCPMEMVCELTKNSIK